MSSSLKERIIHSFNKYLLVLDYLVSGGYNGEEQEKKKNPSLVGLNPSWRRRYPVGRSTCINKCNNGAYLTGPL